MKNSILVLVLLTFISCQQSKIGYVDNVKLMDGYQEKTEVEGKYKAKADALAKKSDSLSQALQIEYQALQAKKQSQRKTQEELQVLQQKGQFLGQQLQQEERQIQQEGQTQMDSIVSKVKDEIKAYGEANGYTYILGGGEGGSVLYGQDANDLTEQILKILNDKYKN
ncbi:OmpH family outer membrane protein [Croceivirga thetidis]|uniref:OmpH family outer membrane protein n=1 Tax=Croceivirga thetidis TaxID=2721623 RepID=A0ABX1GNG9_9FLAO|nr:OmpH family outer membrane protein [Croceivirga thetidis]NKI31218.1 OmpH family outer membrane protein [Croceivirga thetidis]